MASFSGILARRECGFSGAGQDLQQRLDRQIEHNLIEDRFHFNTITLSPNHRHNVFQCLDRVAVLSMNKTGQKVQSLALYSLNTRCRLWEITIDPDYTGINPGSCSLSESGMVVVHSESAGDIIVLDGKVTGVLPKLNCLSKVSMGNRILICWTERHNNQGPYWIPENSNCFFGEWDKEGKRLSRYPLDNTQKRWDHHQYVYSKNFWVRLTDGSASLLPSTIEVVDRVTGTLKRFKLPLNQDKEQFFSACIDQNRLIYGKGVMRPDKTDTLYFGESPFVMSVIYKVDICIYDLVKGVILEEIPIETDEPEYLVASQNYVAWLARGYVRYLDIQNKTVKDATEVPYCTIDSKVILNIAGKALSVVYVEGSSYYGWGARWIRKVVDLSSGTLKCDVRYKRDEWTKFSISDGKIVIPNTDRAFPHLYTENFIGEGDSDQEASQREHSGIDTL